MSKKASSFLLLLALLFSLVACEAISGGDGADALEAAGFVEAVEVLVAPELGGRVSEVFVTQGDKVETGDPLFRLEDTALAAQLVQAQAGLDAAGAGLISAESAVEAARANLGPVEAAVDAAQAGVDAAEAGLQAAEAEVLAAQAALEGAEASHQQVLIAARLEERSGRVEAWSVQLPEEFETPSWYFDEQMTLDSAEAELSAAEQALNDRAADLLDLIEDPDYSAAVEAERRLAQAQAAFLVAAEVRARPIGPEQDESIDAAVQALYDQALADLEAAQADETLFSSPEGAAILEARANLAAAKERFETAADNYYALQTGEQSLAVLAAESTVEGAQARVSLAVAGKAAAEASVAQAEAGLAQAEAAAEAAEKQIELAETGVDQAEVATAQAQAALGAVEAQMDKLSVAAAVSGVVLVRSIQPGEVIGPGTPALTIGLLDDLTVTVYLPEDRYGQVSLGDEAAVSVDSFPDESFPAVVEAISDQAEFTPRNVQTVEERQTTVYAIKLSITDPDGRLKPGMPADVTFD